MFLACGRCYILVTLVGVLFQYEDKQGWLHIILVNETKVTNVGYIR